MQVFYKAILLATMLAAWWMPLAFAEDRCPDGATLHEQKRCSICVDEDGFLHGIQEFYEGGRRTWDVVHGHVLSEHEMGDGDDENPIWQTTKHARSSRELVEEAICGDVRASWWEPRSPSGATLQRTDGEVVGHERYFGWGRRLYQTEWLDDRGEVHAIRTGRRRPAPEAHMRGHWTDGYYGRRDHGRWMHTHEAGQVERGRYRRGQPQGRWTVTTPDGRDAERGRYADGHPQGRWKCAPPDGSSARGRYRDGSRVGTWVWFDAEGEAVEVVHYHTGEHEPLRGRHWTGGLLNGNWVPNPCVDADTLEAWSSAP